jgi:hypothetical protein
MPRPPLSGGWFLIGQKYEHKGFGVSRMRRSVILLRFGKAG